MDFHGVVAGFQFAAFQVGVLREVTQPAFGGEGAEAIVLDHEVVVRWAEVQLPCEVHRARAGLREQHLQLPQRGALGGPVAPVLVAHELALTERDLKAALAPALDADDVGEHFTVLGGVGGALGPAVLGALLTAGAVNSLPQKLIDAGVAEPVRDRVIGAVDTEGLAAAIRRLADDPDLAQRLGVDAGGDTYTLFRNVPHTVRGSLLIMGNRVRRAELWLADRANIDILEWLPV